MPVGSVDVLAEPWEPSCGDARAAGSTGALLPPALRCELCLKAVRLDRARHALRQRRQRQRWQLKPAAAPAEMATQVDTLINAGFIIPVEGDGSRLPCSPRSRVVAGGSTARCTH